MRRSVGTTFKFKGKMYKVCKKETFGCDMCAFKSCADCTRHHISESGECCGETRGDDVDVYFKEVDENRQRKICVHTLFAKTKDGGWVDLGKWDTLEELFNFAENTLKVDRGWIVHETERENDNVPFMWAYQRLL